MKYVAAILLATFFLSSCKKDEPYVKPNLSLATSTKEVYESDDTLNLEVRLDKPADKNISINYTLKGDAREKSTVSSNEYYDYEDINGGIVEIKKGNTSGIIQILLVSDPLLEDDETIDIKLGDVDNVNIQITRNDETEITVKQEDGLIVLLKWPKPNGDSIANMDIFLRVGSSIASWDFIIDGSADTTSNVSPEYIFIPKSSSYHAYGLSYVYYSGTMNRLPFTAKFIDFIKDDFEPESETDSSTAIYTLANKHKWTLPTIGTTKVVQTFEKSSSGGFTPPTPISVPPSGSRIGFSNNTTSLSQFKIKRITQLQDRLQVLERLKRRN